MLIVENYTPKANEFVKFALENKIQILYKGFHITHLLQPLDVDIFRSLANYYKKKLEKIRG